MKTAQTSTKQCLLKLIGLFAICLFMSIWTNPLFAQSGERTVKGVVTSLDGPLMGATVLLKGVGSGVMTQEDGSFTFPEALKENDVLVVSYLGYETAEVKITGNTTYLEPYLEDIPIVIIASLRTKKSSSTIPNNKN